MPSLVRGLRHRATGATGASSTAHSAAPRRAWQHAVAAPLLHRPYSARATVRTRSEYSMRVAPVFAMQFGATRNTGHLLAVCDEMGWVTLMDARVLEDEGQQAMEVSRSSGVRQTPYIGDGGLSAGTFFGGVGGAGAAAGSSYQSAAIKHRAMHHKNGIFNLTFGHGDKTVLTASGDQTCRVWDLEKNACRARLFGHTGTVKCIRPSNLQPDVLATSSRDGSVRVWDLRTLDQSPRVLESPRFETGFVPSTKQGDQSVHQLHGIHKPTFAPACTARATGFFASGMAARPAAHPLFTTVGGRGREGGQRGSSPTLMSSTGHQPFASANDDGSSPPAVYASSSSARHNINPLESPMHPTSASPAEPATQPRRNNAARPSTSSGHRRRKRTPRVAQTSVTSVLFTLDDRVLLTSGAVDGLIKAWDTRKLPVAKSAGGKAKGRRSKQPGCLFEISPGHQTETSNSYSGPSEMGASSCHNGSASESNESYIYSSNAAGSPGSSSSISASDFHRSAIGTTNTRSAPPQRSPRRHGISSMNLDSTGSRLLVSYLGIGVHEYQIHRAHPALVSSGHRVYSGHRQQSFYIRSCFSPDDRHVLSGSSDGVLCMWEARPGGGLSERERDSQPIKLEGHSEEVTACAWSQFDRGVVASCSDDSTIKLWRMDREARLPKRRSTRQQTCSAVQNGAAVSGRPRHSTGSGFFRDRRGGHGYYYVGGGGGGNAGTTDGDSAGAGSQNAVDGCGVSGVGLDGARGRVGGGPGGSHQGADTRQRKQFHMTRAPKRARVEQQSSIFRYMRRSTSACAE